MEYEYYREVIITIEDHTDEVYAQHYFDGVSVLVDASPIDDPRVAAVHTFIAQAPETKEQRDMLLEACLDVVCEKTLHGQVVSSMAAVRTAIAKAKGE